MTNINLLPARELPSNPLKMFAKTLRSNPFTTLTKNLLTEKSICKKIGYTTEIILAAQVYYFGYYILSRSLSGCTYSHLVETTQRSLFLDEIFRSLISDRPINNLDAYALIGLGLPHLLILFRDRYRAKLGNIIGTKSHKEIKDITGYRPTVMEKIGTTMTTFWDSIPKSLAFVYTSILLLKTDIISLCKIFIDNKMANAQTAIAAAKSSLVDLSTVIGLYIFCCGIKIFFDVFKRIYSKNS